MQSYTASSDRAALGQPEHTGFSVSSHSRDITTAVMKVQGEAERMAGLCVTAAPEKSLVCVPQPFT